MLKQLGKFHIVSAAYTLVKEMQMYSATNHYIVNLSSWSQGTKFLTLKVSHLRLIYWQILDMQLVVSVI